MSGSEWGLLAWLYLVLGCLSAVFMLRHYTGQHNGAAMLVMAIWPLVLGAEAVIGLFHWLCRSEKRP